VVADVLVAIGHHCATTIPTATSHDVNFLGKKCIRRSHDGADIEVVLQILYSDVERMPPAIQISDDLLEFPVSVLVDYVPPIALAQ